MLKNENIICISSIDWDFNWQQHQTIMTTLAKNNNRVLFIENTGVRVPKLTDAPRLKKRIINWFKSVKGFRKEMENLYIYSPLILPFPYFKIARWINRRLLFKPLIRWMKVIEFGEPIIWTFLPTPIVLDLAEEIHYKAFVYYCTDNFAATSKMARKVLKYEKKVLQKADTVFVMAKSMYEYCLNYNKNVTCIPMGVDTEIFIKPDKKDLKPLDIVGASGRIIGYVGGVRHSIDQALVKYLAEKLSDYTFVFVGPIQTNVSKLSNLKNIIFVGQKPHNELPRYIKFFDTCIIPYKKDAYTDSVSPAKLNEYLIMGKPVVSTRLKEMEMFNADNNNILYIADDYRAFVDLTLEAIEQDNESIRNRRIGVAQNNSWDKKIEQMSSIVESVIDNKKKMPVNWQKNLINIYKYGRRKIFNLTLLFTTAWLLIFYTPLLWFLAEPLKISQTPQKADAIVIFAGGVGESGKAGQGFEERVQYAVDLYKKGYARYLVFSSGYMYVFREPLVMKALAISLGVPAEAIILEDNAKNTYENIKFTKQILINKGWNKILLVSSPYHMLRASLVFNKIAKEIKVYYTPIPKSLFFLHENWDSFGRKIWKQTNLEQIKAIFHEYLGIIYYFLQGYI